MFKQASVSSSKNENNNHVLRAERCSMPKVVLDQRERYDQSELFAQLSSDSVIVYAGFGNLAAGAARRDKLLGDLALRRVELVSAHTFW